jgi:hypothetical protein
MDRLTLPPSRGPKRAGEDLVVLQKWEEFTAWLLLHTARWPKACRVTLTQRIENHALDIIESLVVARYDPVARAAELRDVNLRLERLRFLFRLARARTIESAENFERAMRRLDEAGRMLHGWRERMAGRKTAASPSGLAESQA